MDKGSSDSMDGGLGDEIVIQAKEDRFPGDDG